MSEEQYDNTNRGQIWPNDKKLTDKHPDFTGSLDVSGVEYWISAWKRKPDANPKAPSLSFSIQLKEPKQEVKHTANPTGGVAEPVDGGFDDIPF